MSIKLVAIDIDGTLLNSKKEITPSVFEAIQDAKAAGVKIVITTGRPIAGVSKLLKELHLMDPGDYVITFNGGLVQETATEKNSSKTFYIMRTISISSLLLTNSKSTLMRLLKTASIPAIAISDATPFMNLNWSICPFITGRLKKFERKNLSRPCISMNQIFWILRLQKSQKNFRTASPWSNQPLFI